MKIGDLEKKSEAIKVAGPNFDRQFPRRGGPMRAGREAVVREGADEPTLRREDEGMLRTQQQPHKCGGWQLGTTNRG